MATLLTLVPYVVVAVGIVAYVGGRRCIFAPEKAGVFAHPAAGIAALVFMFAMMAPIAAWFARSMEAGGQVAAVRNLLVIVGAMLLYARLLAYHATQLLARIFATVSDPEPEPEDPFERAKTAEARGRTVMAIERYEWLLEHEPSHVEARTRLVELLSRTGRIERAKKLLDDGLDLADLPPGIPAEWRALMLRLEEGGPDETAPEGPAGGHKALGEVRTLRLDAHETPSDDDVALPESLEREPVREDEDASDGDDVLRGPEWR